MQIKPKNSLNSRMPFGRAALKVSLLSAGLSSADRPLARALAH